LGNFLFLKSDYFVSLRVIALSSQNDTQNSLFQEYIEYFQSKQRVFLSFETILGWSYLFKKYFDVFASSMRYFKKLFLFKKQAFARHICGSK
jgi:hypothetical protein